MDIRQLSRIAQYIEREFEALGNGAAEQMREAGTHMYSSLNTGRNVDKSMDVADEQ